MHAGAITGLFLLTVLMFGGVIFTSENMVLSLEGADLYEQFIFSRHFGFSELKNGDPPLWNPHICLGTAFLGDFESALFYPPNVVFLIFPLAKAINISIALHVFLCGLFMYLWGCFRKLSPLSAFFSAALLMFSGAFFLHIYPGHVSTVCTMSWAPLVFLAIDAFFWNRSTSWILIGSAAVAMQIFAGHPQHVYYTGLCGVIFAGLKLIKSHGKVKAASGMGLMFVWGAALAAIQLLPGIAVAGESIRGGGVSAAFAGTFSFPPENFITLFAPGFFGDSAQMPYWGRWYPWEMNIFFSVTGFVMAVFGVIYGNRSSRRVILPASLIFLLLALGSYTPLHKILYYVLPGFGKFRGSSKFIFQASIFLCLLSGSGLEWLRREKKVNPRIPVILLASGAAVIIFGISIRLLVKMDPMGAWGNFMSSLYHTGECFWKPGGLESTNWVRNAGFFASKNLMLSSRIFFILAVVIFARKYSRRVRWIVVIFGIMEVFLFARSYRAEFELNKALEPELKKFAEKGEPGERIILPERPNLAMYYELENAWGNSPLITKRYAEFMTFTQGGDPDKATQYIPFRRYHPFYRMLRCRHVISRKNNDLNIRDMGEVAPRIFLARKWKVVKERDKIFGILNDENFKPRETVLLEESPAPEPKPSEKPGKVELINFSTDKLEIRAEIDSPAILVITDGYGKGWRAGGIEESRGKEYRVLPADYVLRAIPLSGGKHHILVEYRPASFTLGKWITIIALFGLGITLIIIQKRKKFPPKFTKQKSLFR